MKFEHKIFSFFLLFTLCIPQLVSAASRSFDKDLYFGLKKSTDVKFLQQTLKQAHCFRGKISGNFDETTRAGVRCFQAKNNFTLVPQNGYVGTHTRKILNEFISGIYVGTQHQSLQTIKNTATTNKVSSSDEKSVALNDAFKLVSHLPEVETYQSELKKKGGAMVVDSDGTIYDSTTLHPYWSIHVYENVADHSATFNWYKVYLRSGKIDKEFRGADRRVCAQDSKKCPDGSYVSRTAPACEFTTCKEKASTWKKAVDNNAGITFLYPVTPFSEYIDGVTWPPKIQAASTIFKCSEIKSNTGGVPQISRRVVNGREYCITATNDGAAGSIYTEYTYSFPKNGKTIVITFTLRTVQCANFDSSQESICEENQRRFDIDGIIDRIAQSIVFKK